MNKLVSLYYELINDLNTHNYNSLNIISRKYTCQNGIDLICSISVSGRRRILSVPINNDSIIYKFPNWNGIQIKMVTLPEYASESTQFVELEQNDNFDYHIFEILADDLRKQIETIPDRNCTSNYIIQFLKKWDEFFRSGKSLVLSDNVAQGLFGELLFLKELILHYGGRCVYYWESENNTHDFYINKNAVEIKTCSCQAPYRVKINSANQLDNKDVKGLLFLRVYVLRISKNGGRKLPSIISEIRLLLKNDHYFINAFNNKLIKIGYYDIAENLYDTFYTIRDTFSYQVVSGFPRIIVNDLPVGVSNIEYDLNIANCLEYLIEHTTLINEVIN